MPRLAALLLVLAACTSERLPDALPFEFTRAPAGTAPTAAETAAFTKQVTGFWKSVDYFAWANRLAHGLPDDFDPKQPGYLLWWGQVKADKAGGVVALVHDDWDDNLTIEMSKLMAGLCGGYLATGDAHMRRLVVGFSRGYAAFVKAMRWGGEPADEFLWARAVYNHDHAYTVDGRTARVDYAPVRRESLDWNAHTVANETNPTWGSIWLRNSRSKDDVPHILRVAPWLERLVQDAPDADVRAAAAEALSYMQGFARDTVTHGYVMRSKERGQVYVPEGDLATYTTYDQLLPNGECDAKLTLSLVARTSLAGLDCGNGIQPDFETASAVAHYYTVPIARYFHVSALAEALLHRENALAQALLEGLAERADAMATDPKRAQVPEWDADRAATLVAAAATGLPLTGDEAHLVQAQFSAAATLYAAWPDWDLWSAKVPDGRHPYAPDHRGPDGVEHATVQEMVSFLEYCASPWRNPAGVAFIDCDVVRDPARWGK